MTPVTNLYINHFNIIIDIYYLLSVVKTNAEMSCHSINTPIPTYVIVINHRHRQTDRQRTLLVHRMVKCMPTLLRDLEACSLN